MTSVRTDHRAGGFTLIELLVVVGIISMLISILMPSLSRARDQAKGVHCLARFHDYASALSAYENINFDALPPAQWSPGVCEDDEPVWYGWCEILYGYVYKERVFSDTACDPAGFTVQRNTNPQRWGQYFICKASMNRGLSSGHYRVYLPGWASGTYSLNSDGTFDELSGPDPTGGNRSAASPKMVLLGDANERSQRGDGDPMQSVEDDCSYIDAGEANISGDNGYDGNRFSDRHYGGTNFLFQDLSASWRSNLRAKLACDWDLNGVVDIACNP